MSNRAGKESPSREMRPAGVSRGTGVPCARRLLRARRRPEFLILFLALLMFVGACQKKPQSASPAAPAVPSSPMSLVHFQRGELSFEAGNYAEAAQAYQLYLQEGGALVNRDRVLLRLGLAHALPGSLVYDWTQATSYLKQLTDAFPQSLYAREARLILALHEDLRHLQGEVERLQGDVVKREAKIKQLSDELERLKEIDLRRRPSRPPR